MGITNRGSTAFITCVMRCSRTSAATASAEPASTCVDENRESFTASAASRALASS